MTAEPQADRVDDRATVSPPLRPFRALRYVAEHVGDLAAVLGPADDVPTAEQAAALAAQHPHHCLHLEVPDPDGRSFQTAARVFRAWRAQGIVQPDAAPACYVYAHRFVFEGQPRERFGVFLAASLDPHRGARLLPHEGTTQELVERRERQLEAVQVHAGAVYAIWDGEGTLRQMLEAITAQERPLWRIERSGEWHTLWAVHGSQAAELAALIASRPLVVADGHHRLEAAKRYAQRYVPAGSSSHPAAWVPVHVVDAADPALVVRPIHRLLRWLPCDWDAIRSHLVDHAKIVQVIRAPSPDMLIRATETLAARVVPHALVVHAEESLEVVLPGDDVAKPDALLVDTLVLRHVCAFDQAELEQVVEYTPDVVEAALAVRSGRAALAILLRPTPLKTVLAWAERGQLLPPKTTYFFPKLPQGLVFFDLADSLTLS
ncbi:DUF1015 domain-containing protein [Thermomicrobium sp. CFH 73360]|uniref:DUF1015 family protein n=1 Tax=Thermomicrobium sp. CFH 73360 TaxID=2951987 RepID=UPI00207713EC|nr:DUF1015 domain-containing protein [Thermomicrobium sp. CFH 73360]